jgi:hypothetical protein
MCQNVADQVGMPQTTEIPTLLGRLDELGRLRLALARASDGVGGLVALMGEPGIGKSALVEALLPEATRAGFAVETGRTWELGNAPAYFPLRPCLRALGMETHPALEAAANDASAFHLWEEVLGGLARAADERPLLLVVEDIHAADAQTLDLLLFLAPAVRATRALILVTARPRDPRMSLPTRQRMSRLLRAGEEIALGPLSAEAAATLAARWARGLGAGDLAGLVARTGGNPLFVRECARALGAASAAPGRAQSIPETVLAAVNERVDLLPPATRALLGSAAVLGTELAASVLARMEQNLPARVIDTLAPAVSAGILDELEPGRFRFTHALIRDAIERGLTAKARVLAHARAEAALAALGDAPHLLTERARHALEALAPGRQESTLALVGAAVGVLEREGAFDRAFDLAALALAARDAGSLPPATGDDLLRAASLGRAAGHHGEHRRLALTALAMARARRDAHALARAALELGAEIKPGVVDPALVQGLEEAVACLSKDAAALRCRVRARLGAALQPAPDPEGPMIMARAAIAEARELDDEGLLCDVLHDASAAITNIGDATETEGLARELLGLARARRDPERALRAYSRLALSELERGRFEAFDARVDEMLAYARSFGHPRLTWRALLFASTRSVARGRFDESEAHIAEVARLDQVSDDPQLFVSLRAHQHMRALTMHRSVEVHGWLATMAENAHRLSDAPYMVSFARGLAAARLGERAIPQQPAAEQPIDRFLHRGRNPSMPALLGEICAASGTPAQRAMARDWLLPHAARAAGLGQMALSYEGPVERVLGLLDASLGDAASAERRLGDASELCRRLGLSPWVARIAFELGSVRASAGNGVAAAAAYDETISLCEALGMPELAARARAAQPGRALVAPPIEAPPPPELRFARDGEMWLITQGDRALRVRDSRGMELVAKLVARPREELHVLVLAGGSGPTAPESAAGPALDERAASSYRERLRDLDEELDDAEGAADLGAAEKLRHERDFLQRELGRAFGLGGTSRPIGSTTERARVNVQRRIKDAVARVAALDPALAAYLRHAIRTGTFCSFRP